MKLWIFDSRAEKRWRPWLQQMPDIWEALLISEASQVPTNDEPTLLLIHDGDGWTWVVPERFPSAQVIRYTGAPRSLETHGPTGQLFCGLEILQTNLLPILLAWPAASRSKDWLWDMLGGNVALELSLELLHQLLPPALNETSPQGLHREVWDTLTEYVYRLKHQPDFKDIEIAYKKAHSLYEMCMTVDRKYIENLKDLRDSLLGNNASTSLIEVLKHSRRSNGA